LLSIELARRSSENDCKREQLEQVLERERKRCMTKYYYI